MFVQYFNLKEQPFGATPDPRFLFRGNSHREALAGLYCGLYGNRSFTVLIAEPGMGKTTLLYEFLSSIRDRTRTVFLFNTLCEPYELFAFILRDLGITPGPTLAEMHQQLNDVLVAESRAGRQFVLVIDEAQNLSERTLEAVRLLTNFETSRTKLMHVVLAGHPTLAEHLAKSDSAAFFQRVSTLCRLAPFTVSDTGAYIAHRLQVAGYEGRSLFSASAIHLIAKESQGIPRIINTLCFNSLCICRAVTAKKVEREMAAEAIADLQLESIPPQNGLFRESAVGNSAAPFEEYHATRRLPPRPVLYAAAVLLVIVLAAMAGVRAWDARVDAHSAAAPQASATASQNLNAKAQSTPGPAAGPANTTETIPAAPQDLVEESPALQIQSQPSSILVADGDTLEKIAMAHLGTFDGSVLRQIQQLNPGIKDPNHIEKGRTIRLPGRKESNPLSTRGSAKP